MRHVGKDMYEQIGFEHLGLGSLQRLHAFTVYLHRITNKR